jgi:hypothetical protein
MSPIQKVIIGIVIVAGLTVVYNWHVADREAAAAKAAQSQLEQRVKAAENTADMAEDNKAAVSRDLEETRDDTLELKEELLRAEAEKKLLLAKVEQDAKDAARKIKEAELSAKKEAEKNLLARMKTEYGTVTRHEGLASPVSVSWTNVSTFVSLPIDPNNALILGTVNGPRPWISIPPGKRWIHLKNPEHAGYFAGAVKDTGRVWAAIPFDGVTPPQPPSMGPESAEL